MRSDFAPSPQGADNVQQTSSKNSAPSNRRWREKCNNNQINHLTAAKQQRRRPREEEPAFMLDINQKIQQRSRKLTVCLISLVAAVSCLPPFVSLHLTQRIGLLLFEANLVQLRSTLYSVIICLLVLVAFYMIVIFIIDKHAATNRRSWLIQRTIKQLIGLFAIVSAISYLSLAIIVPQLRQIQRMPIATFDCNANLITIENCHQQFTSSRADEQTVFEIINELLVGDVGGTEEPLIKKLNCLKYNDKDLKTLQVPTRFLLHKCGLVCKPQRQQLHQFSDDLNREQSQWSHINPPTSALDQQSTTITTTTTPETPLVKSHLVPPYLNKALDSSPGERHYIYHNASSPGASFFETAKIPDSDQNTSQVSLKVCFSGEFSGGSNYKQFCITNLANHAGSHKQDQTLTIGQLNAMLKKFTPESLALNQQPDMSATSYSSKGTTTAGGQLENSIEPEETTDQATHYVNPVVQFESHFKNWPHLPVGDSFDYKDSEESWCKFKPIPPFIVNNKPFSDIQCSLEHEYTMTTGPSLDSISFTGRGGTDNIYLKKSSSQSTDGLNSIKNERRERCNIQCKVNILYQVHVNKNGASSKLSNSKLATSKEKDSLGADNLHYYLPLKPCVIVSNDGDKSKTSEQYIFFRSIGDSTLILAFAFLDLFILFETIDTKQFQLEAKKVRLVSLLLIVTLLPLIVAILFDLITFYYPSYNLTSNEYVNKSKREGYLITLINEQIVPSLSDLFSKKKKTTTSTLDSIVVDQQQQPRQNSSSLLEHQATESKKQMLALSSFPIIDNFILPFFFYSIFMFVLAINSFLIPSVISPAPLIRVSSTEELGMSPQKDKRVFDKKTKATNQHQHKQQAKLINRKFTLKMISLYLICLFMGVQFNLNQHAQTQILIESFGNPAVTLGQRYSTFWFSLGTHSSAAIFVLIIGSLFMNELSSFFSNFSPFKATASASLDSYETKRSRAKFFTYLSLSLIIYSFRCFAIAGMNLKYKFKYLVVFLFQVAELFNFPLTWFAITTRAHEITTEHRVKTSHLNRQQGQAFNSLESTSAASGSGALNLHIVIQSSVAITYFIIAKAIALILHGIYVYSHLNNDDVDWFITSFYNSNKLQANNNTSSAAINSTGGESLFSPLPGERQTYLHASRLFLKYNSLLCFITGFIFLTGLVHVKYLIWTEQRQTVDISQSGAGQDESIDERLSLDLMRIHSNSTRTIYPEPNFKRSSSELPRDQEQSRAPSPRAKILFHYNLDREPSSDSSLSSSYRDKMSRKEEQAKAMTHSDVSRGRNMEYKATAEQEKALRGSLKELRIPIQIERATDDEDFEQLNIDDADNDSEKFTAERIVRHRNKRVRIFEDSESWPEDVRGAGQQDEEVVATELRPPALRIYSKSRPDSSSSSTLWEQNVDRREETTAKGGERGSSRKRSISFAPNATLMGEDGFSEYHAPIHRQTVPKRASPEPSIGYGEEDEEEESVDNYGRNRQADSMD